MGRKQLLQDYIQWYSSQTCQENEEGSQMNALLAASTWNLKKMIEKLKENFLCFIFRSEITFSLILILILYSYDRQRRIIKQHGIFKILQ